MSTISTTELRDRLDDPTLTIVDVRPLAAYNGWRLDGEARGGHIPGARAFPAAWLAQRRRGRDRAPPRREGRRPRSRRRRLRRRRRRRARPRGRRLQRLGHRRRRDRSTAGSPAWAADPALPGRAARPPRASSSTSTGSATLLAGGRPEAAPTGHVPPVPRQLRRPRGVRRGPHPGRPLPRHELARGPGRLEPPLAGGARRRAPRARASPATRPSSSTAATPRATPNEKWPGRRAGQIAATRAAMILRYAGVDDVRLLDGGYDWWVRAGNPLETDRPRADRRSPAFGVHDPAAARGHRRHRRGQGRSSPTRTGAALVSVRTWREHIGQVSGYNYIGPGRPDQGRRLGQLRHGRVPHAALPERRQHDARLPGDRGELGRGRDHARQVGRVLLRHRLAGERDLVLRAICRAGSGSRSTTAAGSSGARIPINNPIEIGEPLEALATPA